MGNTEKETNHLSTAESLTWILLISILIAQYGLGIMAEPIPEKFIYGIGAAALGLNQLKK